MEIVRADGARLDEVEPLFKAMHEHHRAGGPRAAEVRPFRSADEAWERRRAHYRSLLEAGRGHLFLAEEAGRAIAYAMVSELGAGELMLYVMDGNESALRFYERYGMRPYLHVLLGAVPDDEY